MSARFVFLSHPNVVIDPAVAITDWPLSATGLSRLERGLAQPWMNDITGIYASTERKAYEAAAVLGGHLSLAVTLRDDLGENDRSSTGYLPLPEFEATADAFFASPWQSIRGWERAVDAQGRIVSAVEQIVEEQGALAKEGLIAIVSHGAVGALLYCHLAGLPISRRWDQPQNGGGNFYQFELSAGKCVALSSNWQAIDQLTD